ncbi:MAG: hypothetical protein WD273_00605 [Trueperaceae bacterium]
MEWHEELTALAEKAQDKFLVKTDYGDVVVRINPECANALEGDLLLLEAPDAQEEFSMETPLRAFGAKMVDIIRSVGTGGFDPGGTMLEMMIKEKAASDLNRIERWARANH